MPTARSDGGRAGLTESLLYDIIFIVTNGGRAMLGTSLMTDHVRQMAHHVPDHHPHHDRQP
jgi:hypothetical protein